MQSRFFLSFLLLLSCSMAFAQRTLLVEDRSQSNDVYSSDGDEAAVIIRCDQSIPLTFSSTMDKSAEPFRTELQGSDSVYFLSFPASDRYRGRILTVMSPGYEMKNIQLDLNPKQLLTFYLSDPDATVGKGCYVERRNKAQQEIKACNYEQAKDLLEEARSCSDVDTTENNANLQIVDSLIYYRKKGDLAFRLLDYKESAAYYEKAMMLNPYDTYVSNRYTVCLKNHETECDVAFKKAEYYFGEKIYDKAKDLYTQVVNRDCGNMVIATERLNLIDELTTAKKNHARVLTYEYNKNTPVGIHYGKYNMHKAGGFISFDFNNVVFDAMRGDCNYNDTKEKFPECNIAFGWTIKLFNPIWIFFGPGVTGKLYYGTYKDDHYPCYKDSELEDYGNMSEEQIEKANEKTNLAFAVSPVVGLCFKYSFVAARVTYQYRWSIKSELDDFMETSRVSFGLGFAF